jgi:ankyrin repeat protein
MGQTFSSSSSSSSVPSAESLLAASMEGNLDQVKTLLGKLIADSDNQSSLSSCVNKADSSGNTALHGAVFGGHLEVVKFLCISCGADLLLKNSLGCSPLWIAAGYDKINCLEFLSQQLDAVGNLENALMDTNTSGDTPFLAAASRGNIAACKSMISLAEKFLQTSDEASSWELKRRMIRTVNNSGDTPLKVVVGEGHVELVTFLLQIDDEISEKIHNSNNLQTKCINTKNNNGLTPLIIACERNNVEIVKILLEYKADVKTCDAKERNPLAVAAFCGCKDVVEYLLSNSSIATTLINEKDENGCTPLWLASRTGDLAMVQLLIDAGADATLKNNEGLSPEEVATKFKKEKVQQYFAER